MGEDVEIGFGDPQGSSDGVRIRMLGALEIRRNGRVEPMPASRKLSALLGYLALVPQAVARSHLCDLLWDGPIDPRAELRWALAKLRRLLDDPGRPRVVTGNGRVSLDLGDCCVDALQAQAALRSDIDSLPTGALQRLCSLFQGDFLDGLALAQCPPFESWLASQRRHYRACHVSLLQALTGRSPLQSEQRLRHLEAWLALCAFDTQAHALLLQALAARGRVDAAEAHLASTRRAFEAEEVDFSPVLSAWRELKRVGQARAPAAASATGALVFDEASDTRPAQPLPRRVSLAVMPFEELGASPGSRQQTAGPGASLAHDVIARLARLRSLFIIARGSVFALAEQGVAPDEAGRRLAVDYLVSGTFRQHDAGIVVSVELVETRTLRIVWNAVFERQPDDALQVLDEIGNRIVASIAAQVETAERNRAMLKPPNALDAWEAYHRGLWHMYRFTRDDNLHARRFFLRSIELDPTYARAHAGLSFTHWQSAFQHWEDAAHSTHEAMRYARHALIVDDDNPAALWAMGRALWLLGRHDDAVCELEQCVALSPNFALGHYSLAFVQSQTGDPHRAIAAADLSRSLSPCDPLLFGMMGARAMAHVRLEQFEQAAEWAVKAAARPNAHLAIQAIAAHCLALAGRVEQARGYAAEIHRALPGYRGEDFLATFHFAPDAAALFKKAARRIGLA